MTEVAVVIDPSVIIDTLIEEIQDLQKDIDAIRSKLL